MLTDGSRAAGGVHPMMRLIADAAPQQGEVAMRSGLPQEVSLYRALLCPLGLCCSASGVVGCCSAKDSVGRRLEVRREMWPPKAGVVLFLCLRVPSL